MAISIHTPFKHHQRLVKKSTVCTTAKQLYTSPTAGSTFDASSGPMTFTWNTDCTVADKVDLTLYSPESLQPIIKIFSGIVFSDGSYTTDLQPKWWNSTASINLYMTLSDSTVPMFLSNALQSSTFAVTYPVSASNAASDSGAMSFAAATSTETPDPIVVVVGASKASDGLSTGKLVAAVLVPILVLLTGLGFYVRYVRSKQAKKRNRWSQAIDNRMSAISGSWVAGDVGRPSTQTNRDSVARNSAFFGGRTSMSSHAPGSETNVAGMGAGRGFTGDAQPEMSEQRPSFLRHPSAGDLSATRKSVFSEHRGSRISFAEQEAGQRQSRISFGDEAIAAGNRKSFASLGKHANGSSRSLQINTKASPRKSFLSEQDASEMIISPSQAQGPFALGDVDSLDQEFLSEHQPQSQQRSRISHHSTFSASSALSREVAPAVPARTVSPDSPLSPTSFMPAPTPGATPDDALRAYAAQRAGHAGGITPVYELDQSQGGLGAGATPVSFSQQDTNRLSVAGAAIPRPGSVVGERNPFRQSMVSNNSVYSTDAQDHPHSQ